MQSVILDKEGSDCGTKKTERIEITNSNKKLFMSRYIKTGSSLTLLTKNNIDSYVGKFVNMRSPMFCIGELYCSKCMGELYYQLGISNVGLISNIIGASLTTLSMKAFHDMTIKTTDINIFDYIS
jgi:hypothetical protein